MDEDKWGKVSEHSSLPGDSFRIQRWCGMVKDAASLSGVEAEGLKSSRGRNNGKVIENKKSGLPWTQS